MLDFKDLKILFEDDGLIVCEKPSGTLSQGTADDCLPCILERMLSQRGEGARIFCVHRLDRETSGVMVFAKNQRAAAHLSEQICKDSFQKEYLAVIEGKPQESCGTFSDLLFYDRTKNKAFIAKKERKGVRRASLEYFFLSYSDGYSAVRIKLHSGRTHQIRVQFSSRGMSLLGDRRYGASPTDRKGIALHAYKLSFLHPRTELHLEFISLPSECFVGYSHLPPEYRA